jgi:hypothetical protein
MPIKSQADQRKGAKYTDQHGRKWWASIEIRTGDPCSPIEPSFTAPILPPQQYLRLDQETPGKITVAYDDWERDLIVADTDWFKRCHAYGIKLYKDAFDTTRPFNVAILEEIGARPHVPDLVTPLGVEPMPGGAALPVQACKAGNLWALGLKGPNGEEPKMPERLRDFFIRPITVSPSFDDEFVEPPPAQVYASPAPAFAVEEEEDTMAPIPSFLKPDTKPKFA